MGRLLWLHSVPVLLALSLVACPDFQPDPPTGPGTVPAGRFATITVEYRQPQHCANTAEHCSDLVVFFGSWMANGDEVKLDIPSGATFWTGVVENVPVNWPPNDEPHYVRVFDPHLVQTETTGSTAARLVIGGQVIYYYDSVGTPLEAGLIYVDDNGVGHNPY